MVGLHPSLVNLPHGSACKRCGVEARLLLQRWRRERQSAAAAGFRVAATAVLWPPLHRAG
eukprot:9873024-Heterocapsa_arctica.AAC.1